MQFEFDPGMPGAECRHQPRQQRVSRRADEAEAHASAFSLGDVAGCRSQFVGVRQAAPRRAHCSVARRRKPDRAASAFEELDLEFVFELADGDRQRRLRHVQEGGGAAEAQRVGDGQELRQLPKFHLTSERRQPYIVCMDASTKSIGRHCPSGATLVCPSTADCQHTEEVCKWTRSELARSSSSG